MSGAPRRPGGPAPFAAKPTLTGARVRLRPVTRADAEPLRAVLADHETRWLTGLLRGRDDPGPDLDPVLLRDWYGSRGLEPERLDLAVEERATGTVVGEMVLSGWDPDSRTVDFRTVIGPVGRDRGLGTEALRLLLGHAFDVAGVHRVQLEVYTFNPRARHVYEKVGFVDEGIRREVLRVDDAWHDAHIMALLDRNWREHRGHPGGVADSPAAETS